MALYTGTEFQTVRLSILWHHSELHHDELQSEQNSNQVGPKNTNNTTLL
jgi:hypothetical protein